MCTGEAARFADKEEAECARVKVRREREGWWTHASQPWILLLYYNDPGDPVTELVNILQLSLHIYILYLIILGIYAANKDRAGRADMHTRGKKIQSQQFIRSSAENNQVNSFFKEHLSVSPPSKRDLLLWGLNSWWFKKPTCFPVLPFFQFMLSRLLSPHPSWTEKQENKVSITGRQYKPDCVSTSFSVAETTLHHHSTLALRAWTSTQCFVLIHCNFPLSICPNVCV